MAYALLSRVHKHLTDESATVHLSAGVVFRLLEVVSCSSVPLLYMLRPSTVPEREDTLSNGARGVQRPMQTLGRKGM